MYNENNNELLHYGVKGMHWGVRRYQNPDGSLTPAGQKRIVKRLNNRRSYKNADEVAMRIYTTSKSTPKLDKLDREFDEIFDKRNRLRLQRNKAERNGDDKQIEKLDKQISDLYRAEAVNFHKRQIEFSKNVVGKWYPELASATLKDIKVADTEAGRKFVTDNYLRPSQNIEQHMKDLTDLERMERDDD